MPARSDPPPERRHRHAPYARLLHPGMELPKPVIDRRHAELSQPHVRRRSIERPRLPATHRSESALLRGIVHLSGHVRAVRVLAAILQMTATVNNVTNRLATAQHGNLWRNQLQSLPGSSRRRRHLFRAWAVSYHY